MSHARTTARALRLGVALAAAALLAACGDDEPLEPIRPRACLEGAGGGTNGLQLFGSTSYRDLSSLANNRGTFLFDPGEISFNNPQLSQNSRTGSLRATLWALEGDYTGGGIRGYVVGRYAVNFDDGSSWLFNGESANLLELRQNADTPPRGSYCMVVTLDEFTQNCGSADGYCIADWMEFPRSAAFE